MEAGEIRRKMSTGYIEFQNESTEYTIQETSLKPLSPVDVDEKIDDENLDAATPPMDFFVSGQNTVRHEKILVEAESSTVFLFEFYLLKIFPVHHRLFVPRIVFAKRLCFRKKKVVAAILCLSCFFSHAQFCILRRAKDRNVLFHLL